MRNLFVSVLLFAPIMLHPLQQAARLVSMLQPFEEQLLLHALKLLLHELDFFHVLRARCTQCDSQTFAQRPFALTQGQTSGGGNALVPHPNMGTETAKSRQRCD